MKACSIGVAAAAFLSLGATAAPAAAANILLSDFVGAWSQPLGARAGSAGSGAAELVKIDDKYYALDISGLVQNSNPVEEFWSRENEKKHGPANLRAQLRLVSAAVPEPANWAMMIVGFGFAGAAVRAGRRRNILATSLNH